MSFKSKTVLVTGAAGGSGAAIAQAFLQEGSYVIASDIIKPAWGTPFEERLNRVILDVCDESSVVQLIDSIKKNGRVINVLVNNAGIAIGCPIEEMTLEIWNKNMTVNATGTFFCTREIVKLLLSESIPGSIINISSIAGKNGFPNAAAYCASKSAIIGFTRSLAVELGPKDITINAICPGSVDTPMISKVVDFLSEDSGRSKQETRKNMMATIPMRRFQTPEDVASLVLFLSSDGARNINGESINLDGGVVRD